MSEARRNRRIHKEEDRNKFALSKITFHQLGWLEYLTMGLGLWFLLYPKPYDILFTVLLCMPILGILLNSISRRPSIASLVTIPQGNADEDYDVADFIDFASWILLIRVLLDFEFESFYSLIIPGTVAFIVMLILLFLTHDRIAQSNKDRGWIYFSLIGSICVYSFAGTYGANCVFDPSEPEVYRAEVVDKHVSGGKHTSYYVKVTPWGHHYDPEDISVSKDHYEEIRIGQSVNIDRMEGLFHIPWYYIER